MRKAVQDFVNQVEDDRKSIEEYRVLLDILFGDGKPLSAEEADALIKLFPDSKEELGCSLLQTMESIQYSRAEFRNLLEKTPPETLKEQLLELLKRKHQKS